MPKSQRSTPPATPEVSTEVTSQAQVQAQVPRTPAVKMKGHKHDGTAEYLRGLANRVAAFERRLPSPDEALSANEMERRASAKGQCKRAHRNLSNTASRVMNMYRGFPAAAKLVHDCVDASDKIRAELDSLYKVIPADTFMALIREDAIAAGGNTPTYRRMQALREALGYLDYYLCSNPACRALLPDDLPIIETAAPAVTTRLDPKQEAYAAMAAEDEAIRQANKAPVPARLVCPECGETLRHRYIGQFSNLSALQEYMPGTVWKVGTNMNEAEQWLLDTERAIDEVVHEVDTSIVFAERIESGDPTDDIEVKALPPEDLKAAAYAAIA